MYCLGEAADRAVGCVGGVGCLDGPVTPVGVAEPEVQLMGSWVVYADTDPDPLVAQLGGRGFSSGNDLRADAAAAVVGPHFEVIQLRDPWQVFPDLGLLHRAEPQVDVTDRLLAQPCSEQHITTSLAIEPVSEVFALAQAVDQRWQLVDRGGYHRDVHADSGP
jgi:hypothetical protein